MLLWDLRFNLKSIRFSLRVGIGILPLFFFKLKDVVWRRGRTVTKRVIPQRLRVDSIEFIDIIKFFTVELLD